MDHVRQKRNSIYEEADHPDIFRKMGVDVESGYAAFKDSHHVTIQDKQRSREVSGRKIFITTGSKPLIPPVKGLKNVDYLTSESLFEINTLPNRLIVVGGGPVGIEMSQAFSRLGSKVTLIDQAEHILSKDDRELSDILFNRLKEEGITFNLNTSLSEVRQNETGGVVACCESENNSFKVEGDRILLATGRQAALDGLNLDRAGVQYSKNGIGTNKHCQTSKSHIYACGDITGRYQFTHMSEHMAKVAVSHAILKLPQSVDEDHVPWCTYSEPELAHVGKRARDLDQAGRSYKTYRFPYDMLDRAIVEQQQEGLIKVHARKTSGKILGVSIAGANAGEMISEYALAMRNGISLREIADTIHPYPTYGLGNRRVADQWYVQNQSEWMVKLIQKIFRYRGQIPDLSDPDRIV
jgi:pyruvate/2-oxoglutarate dehydrogenase complex dihydrolipoamide dehydrogenase (E3) component